MTTRPLACAPVISVIIPTRNAEPYLPATLRSLLDQQPEHWECIFVDGVSTDRTLHLINDFCREAKVRCQVVSETDSGVADALNKGIARAAGEYLYFLCAGDCLRPGAIACAQHALLPRPDVLYGKVFEVSFNKVLGGEPVEIEHFACHNLYHQALIYHRSMFDRFGRYNPRYRSFSDYDYNLRWFSAPSVNVAYSNQVIADYLGGGPSEFGDPVFEGDREALVERYLGSQALAAVQARRAERTRIFAVLGCGSESAGRQWAIFGAGSYGKNMLIDPGVAESVKSFAGFLDNDSARNGSQFCGHDVFSPSKDVLAALGSIVIAVGSAKAREQIRAQLVAADFPSSAIFCW